MFRRNRRLQQELEADPDFRAGLMRKAGAARAAAEAIAPRIMPRNAQAIELQPTPTGARLINTDHGGHIAEFGSVNSPPHAPLRRGVTQAGLHLEESGRAE